jgi:DNA-binding SARP family transcriptional activator
VHDFSILGRVTIGPAGSPMNEIRGEKPRTLAVVLLSQANRLMALDHITDALWDGDPPRSAEANVRTYAWALRRKPAVRTRLRSYAGGYQLEVAREDCDHTRFIDLAAAGRAALDDNRDSRAADLLRDALDLWRGDQAAIGVSRSGPLGAWLDHLDEERVRAVEDLAEAYTRLGEPRAALRELTVPLPAARLRSRNWMLQMRAHRELGEIGKAVDVYHAAVSTFRTTLGVEPDERLRHLRDEITRR